MFRPRLHHRPRPRRNLHAPSVRGSAVPFAQRNSPAPNTSSVTFGHTQRRSHSFVLTAAISIVDGRRLRTLSQKLRNVSNLGAVMCWHGIAETRPFTLTPMRRWFRQTLCRTRPQRRRLTHTQLSNIEKTVTIIRTLQDTVTVTNMGQEVLRN